MSDKLHICVCNYVEVLIWIQGLRQHRTQNKKHLLWRRWHKMVELSYTTYCKHLSHLEPFFPLQYITPTTSNDGSTSGSTKYLAQINTHLVTKHLSRRRPLLPDGCMYHRSLNPHACMHCKFLFSYLSKDGMDQKAEPVQRCFPRHKNTKAKIAIGRACTRVHSKKSFLIMRDSMLLNMFLSANITTYFKGYKV